MADDLNPITRAETFLAGNEPDLTPITRKEAILAGVDLDPVTRKEWFLKKYRSGGGGNPNSQQSITGTVANPWGTVDYTQLGAALASGDAHAILSFSFSGNNVVTPLISYNGSTVVGSVANIAENLANSVSVNIQWNSGTVIYARAVTAGQVQDVTAYTSGIQSNLIIYWHPMP